MWLTCGGGCDAKCYANPAGDVIGWAARYRRLARDYERLADTLAGLRFLAFSRPMLRTFTDLMSSS